MSFVNLITMEGGFQGKCPFENGRNPLKFCLFRFAYLKSKSRLWASRMNQGEIFFSKSARPFFAASLAQLLAHRYNTQNRRVVQIRARQKNIFNVEKKFVAFH